MPASDINLLCANETRAIIGAMYRVHRELGFGFLEKVYRNALSVLLQENGLTVTREQPFEIVFHGVDIGLYRADLVVKSKVVVEVKTGKLIDPADLAQLRNYLKASGLTVGLLINFGLEPDFRRLINASFTRDSKE